MRISAILSICGAMAAAWSIVSDGAIALGTRANVDIKSREGRDLGRVKIVETTAGVLIKLKLRGLPPGPHGFHIHAVGKCEGDFESAGPILNPLGAKHGFLNEEGPMAGDLPNLFVAANGEVEVEILSPFVTLHKDSEDSLLDGDGASLVIFERADDYMTEPYGNAGARIACGVLTPAK